MSLPKMVNNQGAHFQVRKHKNIPTLFAAEIESDAKLEWVERLYGCMTNY